VRKFKLITERSICILGNLSVLNKKVSEIKGIISNLEILSKFPESKDLFVNEITRTCRYQRCYKARISTCYDMWKLESDYETEIRELTVSTEEAQGFIVR